MRNKRKREEELIKKFYSDTSENFKTNDDQQVKKEDKPD